MYETKNNNGKKSVIVNSLVGGLAVCVIAGIANYARYGEKYADGALFLITLANLFVSGTVVSFLMYSLIYTKSKEAENNCRRIR